jgi:hypothetical protein
VAIEAAAPDRLPKEDHHVSDAQTPGPTEPAPHTVIRSREDGELHFLPETEDSLFPVDAPVDATPLGEDEPEGTVPASPLFAMKERRHEQWGLFGHPDRIRQCVGSGDAAVYVIDDGKHHRMIGHRVGASRDGVIYSLVARVDRATHESLASGSISGAEAFARSHEAGLVATTDGTSEVANLFDVAHYAQPDEIPAEYLPPQPYITFEKDLPFAEH